MKQKFQALFMGILSVAGWQVSANDIQFTKVTAAGELITTIKSPRVLSVEEVERILIKRATKDEAMMFNLLERIDKGEVFEVHRKGSEVQTMSFDKQ